MKRKNADFFLLLRGMVDTLRTCPEIDKGGWLAGSKIQTPFSAFRFLFLLAARRWKQQQNIRMKITVIRASVGTRAHIKMRTQIKSPRLVSFEEKLPARALTTQRRDWNLCSRVFFSRTIKMIITEANFGKVIIGGTGLPVRRE